MSATAELACFVTGSRWDDIPAALRHEAKRSLLNFFGGALGVAHDPAVSTAIAVMQPFSGPDHVTVIGRAERMDAMAASFVNTLAANLLDFDDTHQATVIHPTAPVAPPVLALAERHGFSGADVLHAFILGAGGAGRGGLAGPPPHKARGGHITAPGGVCAPAAACARLLGLSAGQTAAALGIATSQSAGLVANLATPAKNVGMGNAARNGLLAALFARAGYDAAPDALEGKLGWARAMGDVPDGNALTGQLGARWEFATNTYKPYPSGIVFHAVIEAALALRAQCPESGSIAAIEVRGSQLLLDRGDRPTHTARDARVSIAHNAAVALVRGRAGVPEFEAAAVADPGVARLRSLVSAQADGSLPQGAAVVTLRLLDGRTVTARVDEASGGPTRPMSDAALEAKFRSNDPSSHADRRMALVWALEGATDVRPLMAAMMEAPP